MLAKFWDLKCCFKKLEAMGNYAPLTELASAVLYARGELSGGRLTCHVPGGTLHLYLEGRDKQIQALFLEGPAEILDILEL